MKRIWMMLLLIGILLLSLSIVMAGSYIPDDVTPDIGDLSGFKMVGRNIVSTLMWIGFAIALGTLIFVGIKYVMSAADEKASMKGMLVKVVIGSLIVAGATGIVNVAIAVFGSN